MERPLTPIVLDASILLNFVKVGRIDLLGELGSPVLLLDQVRAEVIRPEQSQVVTEAITAGIMDLESVTDIVEVTLFADLRARAVSSYCESWAEGRRRQGSGRAGKLGARASRPPLQTHRKSPKMR